MKKKLFPISEEPLITMWDQERKEERIIKQKEKKALLAQIKKERAKHKGIGFLVSGIKPEKLLLKAGYKFRINGGYIRNFSPLDLEDNLCNDVYRYHAYILNEGNAIEIHTDKIKERKDKSIYHIASEYMVPREVRRLKELMPVTIEISRKNKVKSITLKQDLMRQVLQELKERKIIS